MLEVGWVKMMASPITAPETALNPPASQWS